MSSSSKTTEQSQSSTTNPWEPTMGLLNRLIGGYGDQSTGVTAGQSSALANLQNAAGSVPNFGDSASSAISRIFGTDNSGQVGLLNNAYGTLQKNLGATASGANLDPYSTPGFADAIKTATNDITDRVKSVYAGSGRDPSGAGSFAGSLGRGLTEGIAPTIASQYNTNYGNMVNANNSLLSGANSTASGINNLNTSQVQSLLAGISGAGNVGSLYTSPAAAQYAAANQSYLQPFQNLAALLQPSTALAGLGGQSSGTGTSTQTSNPSFMDSLSQGFGLFGKGLSGAGSLMSLLPFSDENLKENITKVGKLDNGENVYRYNFKGSPQTQIGVIAQEVEKKNPSAIVEDPSGFKRVDYRIATRKGRVGALKEAA